jgi:hypothetical protein
MSRSITLSGGVRPAAGRFRRVPPLPIILLLLAATGLSCILGSDDEFEISGRLTSDFGCLVVRSDGRSYELGGWGHLEIPPLGSYVALEVEEVPDAVSTCMVGMIVDVLDIIDVVTDFRTAPVVDAETWSPGDEPIVLGRVEVEREARLTVLAGTTIQIIPEGELRCRGTIIMEGAAGDPVRVIGILRPEYGELLPGLVVLDSVSAESRLSYVTVPLLEVHGEGPPLEQISTDRFFLSGGSIEIARSWVKTITADQGVVELEANEIYAVGAVRSTLELRDNRLSELMLSYSQASATGNRFQGSAALLTFHGAAGGRFEENTFDAQVTQVRVRHQSDPVLTRNNFISPTTSVRCERYEGTECVQMERNWWGTTDEAEIQAKLAEDCPVCYIPWLTEPVP